MPIIALAYFLANRKHLALYHEGTFTPELTAVHVDEWLQDPSRVQWRFIEVSASERNLLSSISSSLSQALGQDVKANSSGFCSSTRRIGYGAPRMGETNVGYI